MDSSGDGWWRGSRQNLFQFLERLSDEGLSFHLRYAGPPATVEVHVDANSDRWLVSFDEDGFTNFSRAPRYETFVEDQSGLSDLFDRLARAWKAAARDLGIRFVSPYSFDAAGEEHTVTGLLPDFGSDRGTLITSRKDSAEAYDFATHGEYHWSGLNPIYYDRYDRDRFTKALNDWGWFGKGTPPDWFGGEVYK